MTEDPTQINRILPGEDDSEDMDRLMLNTGEGKLAVTGFLTIGRDEKNHVTIDEAVVSRRHAIIERVGRKFFIRDLHSTNKTFVNGSILTRGEQRELHAGDEIKIGSVKLEVT